MSANGAQLPPVEAAKAPGAPAEAPAAAPAAASDPGKLTVALKFVEYKRPDGSPVLTAAEIKELVQGMNGIYAPCGIQFRDEQYQVVDPAQYKLAFNTSNMDELNAIRGPFDEDKYLVVVNTGDWTHDTMGPANAWTTMPGENPSGAVIEENVASMYQLVAHELGHYLGLDHVDDAVNLLNPIIYGDSVKLHDWQCKQMHDVARGARAAALR